MRTIALTDFRTQLRRRYDAENQTNRHPDALLSELANAGFRWLRACVTDWGFTSYLAQATGNSSASAADANENYSSITYPSNATQIHAVELYDTPEWVRLEPISLASLRQYEDRADISRAWLVDFSGGVSGASASAGRILLTPICSSRPYKVWYLPEWADMSNDTHVFLYQDENWLQLHLYWCIAQLCTRDQDDPNREQRALFEINPEQPGSTAQRVRSMAPRVQNAGARQVRRSDRYYA